jgi:hypothetical protein
MASVLALRVLVHRSRPIAAGAVSGACEAWARRHTECSAHRQQPPSRSAADDEFYKVLGVPKSASAADIKKVALSAAITPRASSIWSCKYFDCNSLCSS